MTRSAAMVSESEEPWSGVRVLEVLLLCLAIGFQLTAIWFTCRSFVDSVEPDVKDTDRLKHDQKIKDRNQRMVSAIRELSIGLPLDSQSSNV